MTAPEVTALLERGSIEQWARRDGTPPTRTTPLDGFGVRLGPGSWRRYPGWDRTVATRTTSVWPEPASWDLPGLWNTVAQWGIRAGRAKPVEAPWGNGWAGPGGFTTELDNGILIDTREDRSEGWELLGSRLATPVDRFLINWRLAADGLVPPGAQPCRDGHRVATRINQRRPGAAPKGAQGPGWWNDGVLGPEHLAGPWSGPARLVGYNVAFGPYAPAAPGGWTEHPAPEQPYGPGHPVLLPAGDQPGLMVPSWTWFRLDITDDEIEAWLDWRGIDPYSVLRVSLRWYAIGLRTHGFRLAVSGIGNPHLVASSGISSAEKAAWGRCGVTTEAIARDLGRGVFGFGRLEVAA